VRRRVLQATIAAVTVAVVLLGIPLAFYGARLIRDTEVRHLVDAANALGRQVEARIVTDRPLTPEMLAPYVGGEDGQLPVSVSVTGPDGTHIQAGTPIEGQSHTTVVNTDSGGVVIMSISYWDVVWRTVRTVALVVVAATVAFAAGIAMALWQARRLAAPLVYLAASAEQLGSGQVRPRLEASGVEEIDLVAAELVRSADRLAGRLAAERQFASDASHQLRTPLTALSMRLEEIVEASDSEEVRQEAQVALEQVERLVTVVDDLLSRSRRANGGTTEAVHLADVLDQQREEWEPTFRRAGRRLVVEPPTEVVSVLATPGPLAQVLATLIENSLKHGGGTTTVRSRPSGSSAVVVAADGGRLELAQRRPPVFAVFLAAVPRSLDPDVVLPRGSLVSPRRGRRRGPRR